MTRPESRSLIPGTRLGPHEITAAIGAGGMGEVYRGRDVTLNRDVAVKVLPAAFTDDPEPPRGPGWALTRSLTPRETAPPSAN